MHPYCAGWLGAYTPAAAMAATGAFGTAAPNPFNPFTSSGVVSSAIRLAQLLSLVKGIALLAI